MTTETENEKAVESTIRHSFISMGLDKEKSCGEIISELCRENEQLKRDYADLMKLKDGYIDAQKKEIRELEQRFEQLKKKIKENIEFAKKHHEKSMWDKGAISGLQLCLDIMNDKETCEDNANRKLLEQVKK